MSDINSTAGSTRGFPPQLVLAGMFLLLGVVVAPSSTAAAAFFGGLALIALGFDVAIDVAARMFVQLEEERNGEELPCTPSSQPNDRV